MTIAIRAEVVIAEELAPSVVLPELEAVGDMPVPVADAEDPLDPLEDSAPTTVGQLRFPRCHRDRHSLAQYCEP